MCSTRLLARADEGGAWRPAGKDVRCLLHVDNHELTPEAAARFGRNWFIFVCRVDRDLPDVEAIEFSFSTPHGYMRYEPLSDADPRIRPILCSALSDIVRFTLASPDPASWACSQWDPDLIGERLSVRPSEAASAYREALLELMRHKEMASITVEPGIPDTEWYATRTRREFLPHHVARARGPLKKGQYIAFGVIAYDGLAVAGPTCDPLTSGSMALTYWESIHASRVYGTKHEWIPNLVSDEDIVDCLALYLTQYSPQVYSAWSPPIPRMLIGPYGPLHPIPGDSQRFLDCVWAVRFGSRSGREPLEGLELTWEWDPKRAKGIERSIPIMVEPPVRLTRETIRQVAEVNGFRYEDLIIPLIVERASRDGAVRVQKAWIKKVLDMPANRLRDALAIAGRKLAPQGGVWLESRNTIGIKPEHAHRAATFTGEVLAQEHLAALLRDRIDEVGSAATAPGTSRKHLSSSGQDRPYH